MQCRISSTLGPPKMLRGSAGPMAHGDRRNIATLQLVTIFSCYVVVNIVFMDNSVVR